MLDYTFIMEIPYFSLDSYVKYENDNQENRLLIYRRAGSSWYYLFDSVINKLYAFSPNAMWSKINERDVYLAYYLWYPQNQIATVFSTLE